MRPIIFLFIAVFLVIELLPPARAQTADWTVISTPDQVTAGGHVAVAITTPAGATNDVVIVLRAGLRLVSAMASSGVFADGHWSLDGAAEPATLLLLAVVQPTAQTHDDVTVTVMWNGMERQTTTALIGPAPPATPKCTFMPLVRYAAH